MTVANTIHTGSHNSRFSLWNSSVQLFDQIFKESNYCLTLFTHLIVTLFNRVVILTSTPNTTLVYIHLFIYVLSFLHFRPLHGLTAGPVPPNSADNREFTVICSFISHIILVNFVLSLLSV